MRSIVGRFALQFLVLLSISVSIAASVDASAQPPALIFIDTKENDTRGSGDPDSDIGWFIMDFEKQFPDAQSFLVRGSTNEEVKRKLETLLRDPKLKIQALFVSSHGDREIIASEGDFYVNLGRDSEIQGTFGAVQGRFLPEAKVVFLGCSILEGKSPPQAKEFMSRVARSLGLSEGRLYMNRTEAHLRSRIFHGQPIFAKGSWGIKASRLASQTLAVGMLPVNIMMENFLENQGYTLRVGAHSAHLYEDLLFNVTLERLSTGEMKELGLNSTEIFLTRLRRKLSELSHANREYWLK